MLRNGIIFYLLCVVCFVIQLSAAQCDGGSHLALTEQGVQEFTTPNFPDGKYPSNARCSWLIQVTSGEINLQFPDFNLPQETVWVGPCGVTKVEVYDGSTTASPVLGTYCTNTPPPAVTTSSGTSMLVSFTGGFFPARGQGFRAMFTVTGAVATASPQPTSTADTHLTTPSLTTTIQPTISTSTTAARTSGLLDPSTFLSSTEPSKASTNPVLETTTALGAHTTTTLTTTTPEPTEETSTTTASTSGTQYDQTSATVPVFSTTLPGITPLQSTTVTDSSTTTITTQQADTTVPHVTATQPTDPPNTTPQDDITTPTRTTHTSGTSTTAATTGQADTTDPPNTMLQEDTTTPTTTNSNPQGTTVLPTTATERTSPGPHSVTEDMTSSSSHTTSPIGVATNETTSDSFGTGQPFNEPTIFANTETTRQVTKSTRLSNTKPMTTEKTGGSEGQSGSIGLTEGQILMYAAIGGAVAGLLFVGMVAAVCFCRRQRQGRCAYSYAIGFQELEKLHG
ncbi:uncharacterized protein [Branchiostoma lanceolatum]|uniref:uncharacterized protein n=1 Tax=Branchiostoma lanceolatum TaxID=7740 RepID=UPI00345603E5